MYSSLKLLISRSVIIEKTFRYIIAVAFFVMMGVTFVDVLGRYFFGRPLPAAYEMTELLLAIGVFAAMPYATFGHGHIKITLLDGLFSGTREKVRNIVVSIICSVATFGLSYQAYLRGSRLQEYGDHTLFLQAPLAPFAYFIALMSSVMGICFLTMAARHSFVGAEMNDQDKTVE